MNIIHVHGLYSNGKYKNSYKREAYMPNIMDYLEWRGDLTFVEAPLCEVDNLIFCLLSYVDLDGIVPQSVKEGRITLREAAAEYNCSAFFCKVVEC